jgi:hypothetical protein
MWCNAEICKEKDIFQNIFLMASTHEFASFKKFAGCLNKIAIVMKHLNSSRITLKPNMRSNYTSFKKNYNEFVSY